VSGESSPVPTSPTRHPRTHELAAWRSFLRAHASVVRRLEADLLRVHGLSLGVYDVLVQLVEAPERRLRMTDLADAVLLSRSGLTRLVDRLEREGLVRREACDSDARGMFAVMTDEGYRRLRDASGTHLRGVAEYAVGRLDEDDLHQLGRILGNILDGEPEPELVDLVAADELVAQAGRAG
jgi:DNA-binding MarR family transcriptional regulator